MEITDKTAECKPDYEGLSPRVLHRIGGTAGLRIAGMLLTSLTSVLLARLLGVKEFGSLMYILAWVRVFSVIGVFGMDGMLIPNIVNYRTQSDWGRLQGIIRWAIGTALSFCTILILAALFFCPRQTRTGTELASAIPAASCLLVSLVLLVLLEASLQGFNKVVTSQFAEMLIQPGLMVVVPAVIGYGLHTKLSAENALFLYAIAAFAAIAFCTWHLRRVAPHRKGSEPVQLERKAWFLIAFPLFVLNITDVINNQMSSLMLGTLLGPKSVALYSAAEKGAVLIIFPLSAVNLTLGPTFANLYQTGRLAQLQDLVTKSARLILVVAAPVALAMIFAGRWYLLLFGKEFAEAALPLALLSFGQLFNAAAGSVGCLLIMSGHGRDAAVGVGIGVIANLLLSAILIPRWGVAGAASATATSFAIWNTILAIFVWKRLRVATTAFGRFSRKANSH